MPSPFPGMNPFLEQSSVWEDFHCRFMTYAGESLAAQVRPVIERHAVIEIRDRHDR